MSLVMYNGVTLPYSVITDFRQDAVYDDMGNTDRCYTRFDIKVQCVVNVDYSNLLIPDQPAATASGPASIVNVIRSRLLQQKKRLRVFINGVDLIPAPQKGEEARTTDARNGPQPQSCVLTELTSNTFLMTYHIVAHYWENNDVTPVFHDITVQNKVGNDVLFNRWTEMVEIDDCQYTKRTRNGKFVIRSDNASGNIADKVRLQMAVVGVPKGFLRENSNYTISADGLAIQYNVVDQEVFKLPPKPAFKASGEYIESATSNGAVRYGEVRIHLVGAKDTPQAKLIETAIAVATTKMFLEGAKRKQGDNKLGFGILERAAVKVNMYKNEVECQIRARCVTKKRRIASMDAFGSMTTITPFSDDVPGDLTPPYTARGTSNFLIQAARYYDPSLATTKLDGKLPEVHVNKNVPVGTGIAGANNQLGGLGQGVGQE